MEKLQNNFTTPEQSKRLLELGVPADSADCINFEDTDIFQIPFQRPFSEYIKLHIQENLRNMYSPCWSVGRLIEIAFICSIDGIRTIDFWRNDSPMGDIIYEFENKKMDFSKLED